MDTNDNQASVPFTLDDVVTLTASLENQPQVALWPISEAVSSDLHKICKEERQHIAKVRKWLMRMQAKHGGHKKHYAYLDQLLADESEELGRHIERLWPEKN